MPGRDLRGAVAAEVGTGVTVEVEAAPVAGVWIVWLRAGAERAVAGVLRQGVPLALGGLAATVVLFL